MTDTATITEVAEAIRVAMVRANSNDTTAPQDSVYGALEDALRDALELHYAATLPVAFRSFAQAAAREAIDVMIDSGEGVAYALAYFQSRGFVMTPAPEPADL